MMRRMMGRMDGKDDHYRTKPRILYKKITCFQFNFNWLKLTKASQHHKKVCKYVMKEGKEGRKEGM